MKTSFSREPVLPPAAYSNCGNSLINFLHPVKLLPTTTYRAAELRYEGRVSSFVTSTTEDRRVRRGLGTRKSANDEGRGAGGGRFGSWFA